MGGLLLFLYGVVPTLQPAHFFPVAMVTEDARQGFGVTGVPVSFLIDEQGEIRQTVRGAFHEADLRAAVQELLAGARRRPGGYDRPC